MQPQGFLGRLQRISIEEALEHQVAVVLQIRRTTIGHPHRGRKLTASHYSLVVPTREAARGYAPLLTDAEPCWSPAQSPRRPSAGRWPQARRPGASAAIPATSSASHPVAT